MSDAKWFPRACVASPHYLASAAGLAVLAGGGNAMDAAVATNLVLGVVAPYVCGYGGDLFAMVWADGLYGYNGSGRAPAAATPESVRRAVGADEMPLLGPHTVTVPGAVEGWFALLERFGSRSFADLARPAVRYAREGFPLSPFGAWLIERSRGRYDAPWCEGWQSVYGEARRHGLLRQPGLARTIEALCAEGPDAYYRGPIARAIADSLQRSGGLMTADDLAAHAGEWVEPLRTTYRGVEVLQLPPNSQGVAVLEALNIIEGLDIGPPESPARHHNLLEATKLALADRQTYVTDPEHMRIDPRVLASKAWADELRASIDPERASTPAPGRAAVGGTIYLCAADESGMCVSLIQSNYLGFGSGVTVPDWGINLQNRGTFFSLDPDDANVIAPRKRTMHTLSPAMALRDGHPSLVFGTRGGDGQAQFQLLFLTRVLDDGEDIQDAMAAPRWLISPTDWSVLTEPRFPVDLAEALRERGHNIRVPDVVEDDMGHAQAIQITDAGYAAATDPRGEGAALGL